MVSPVHVRSYGERAIRLIIGLLCVTLAADARAPQAAIAPESTEKEAEAGAPQVASHNDIIVLPKVVVKPQEAPLFGEQELSTKAGLDELLRKRFPGASFKGQPSGLDNYAKLMNADLKRHESIAAFQDLAKSLAAVGDLAGSKALREEIEQMALRRPSWREEAMDRNLNRQRR